MALAAVLATAAIAPLALTGPSAAAEPEIPPVVTTSPATPVAGGYMLKATIYTYSLDTHYHFEYGTTTAYGTSAPVPDADAGTMPVVNVSETVTGLAPSTTYHYRVVATNSKGPGTSSDQTFTTSADPSVPPPPAPEAPSPSPGAPSGESGSPHQAKEKRVQLTTVKSKGREILATSGRRTLYSLSAETGGKFICTKASGCLAVWHPLLVPKGATPTGPVKLGTIQRPEGGRQVTYRSRPLYTFGGDTKAGQLNGQGLKDVGTWHAVMVGK
jgi:predicted lipoprotein with Yx(FWY)xxD motif